MKFRLRKCDLRLIRAAIALGDRLKQMPEVTPEIIANIERFQEVLRRLPEATPNVRASYGFGVSKLELEFRGVNRGWYVDAELEPDGSPMLSVYALYTTVPDCDRDEWADRAEEDYFPFSVRPGPPLPNSRWYSHWIEAVRDPDQWRNPDQDFEVEADFEIMRRKWRGRRNEKK